MLGGCFMVGLGYGAGGAGATLSGCFVPARGAQVPGELVHGRQGHFEGLVGPLGQHHDIGIGEPLFLFQEAQGCLQHVVLGPLPGRGQVEGVPSGTKDPGLGLEHGGLGLLLTETERGEPVSSRNTSTRTGTATAHPITATPQMAQAFISHFSSFLPVASGACTSKLAIPTPLQRRAFELIGVPVPIELKPM